MICKMIHLTHEWDFDTASRLPAITAPVSGMAGIAQRRLVFYRFTDEPAHLNRRPGLETVWVQILEKRLS